MRMEERRHVAIHASVPALLKSLKGAGVTHTPGAKVPSVARYRDFIATYTARYAVPTGVTATYAVAYFRGRLLDRPAWVSTPRRESRQA